ncbi:hypothetical protein E2C01_093156 [Portunus trituberculatus]|uniref:Uncharacterized protein n=1 Tax=Portunus trituberculatus TaxID=210409 RepID=A0A5B7JIA6_PORTR|nr:hypothetical protein [Portunus trituberculatus]
MKPCDVTASFLLPPAYRPAKFLQP